jgi:diaminohydroxyphosphoribosylaminopyrimidine deaminase/5-amino-6-(5-phosphoribosylamino)uracil reductase
LPVLFHHIPEDELAADNSLPQLHSDISPATARELALRVALGGVGQVAPNPLVGAVIVDPQHRFISAGAHLQVGSAHAEINAVAAARAAGVSDFSGCRLYVTLEPCAHENRTPSCAKRVIAEKFADVIYGVKDPNPKVAGQGAAMINAAGIPCQPDPFWATATTRLAEFFIWETTRKTPFVGLKAAVSLDGAIARRGDQRQFITGPRARAFGHYLRLKYDAIMIGTWTLLHDNPGLTPRDASIAGRTPWRIVVDPGGRGLEAGSDGSIQLLRDTSGQVIWIMSPLHHKRLQHLTATFPLIKFLAIEPGNQGFIEPQDMLRELHANGITSVLLEGGSGLYRPFILRNAVNRYHLFQAAKFLSGGNKIPLFEGDFPPYETEPGEIEITALGQDWLTEFNTRNVIP